MEEAAGQTFLLSRYSYVLSPLFPSIIHEQDRKGRKMRGKRALSTQRLARRVREKEDFFIEASRQSTCLTEATPGRNIEKLFGVLPDFDSTLRNRVHVNEEWLQQYSMEKSKMSLQ